MQLANRLEAKATRIARAADRERCRASVGLRGSSSADSEAAHDEYHGALVSPSAAENADLGRGAAAADARRVGPLRRARVLPAVREAPEAPRSLSAGAEDATRGAGLATPNEFDISAKNPGERILLLEAPRRGWPTAAATAKAHLSSTRGLLLRAAGRSTEEEGQGRLLPQLQGRRGPE